MMEHRRFASLSVCLLLGACLTGGLARAADPVIDSAMDQQPALTMPPNTPILPAGIVDLWLQALARPEVELRYQAALALVEAHRQGMRGPEKAVPQLIDVLNQPGQDLAVRRTIAQLLVDLDAQTAAASLWKQAQSTDLELHRVVEPALARWHYQPAVTAWLERLRHPGDNDLDTQLAIRGLGTVRDARAVPLLHALVRDGNRPTVLRVEAARVLGTIQPSGLETEARQLLSATPSTRTARLAAVCLLRHHQGAATVALLQQVLSDSDLAVAGTAVTHLVELDPKAALPALGTLLASRSAEVRRGAVEVLFHEINPARLPLLAQCCDDPHPDVRRQARDRLRELASRSELHGPILTLAMQLLQEANWRGQEQAALLLAQLDYKPAAGRLVELLRSDRSEVGLAAAWALRKLAVPSTLPAVLAYVRDPHPEISATDGSLAHRERVLSSFDQQISQLIQFLGQGRYQPADPVLRIFLSRLPRTPRPPVRGEGRAAAVWTLGMLHEGKPDPALAKELARRLLMVFTPAGGDDPHVTTMFVVSLAHMKAVEQLPAIRTYWQKIRPGAAPARVAAIWASRQLSDKPFPPDPPIHHVVGGWFLSPVEHAEPRKR